MLPVDPNHRVNHRDDGCADFAELKREGLVRDATGRIIPIDKPHVEFSPIDRDQLYQDYCGMMAPPKSDRSAREWLRERVKSIRGTNGRTMSVQRARDIINEGNGQWPGKNMQWWRGISLES